MYASTISQVANRVALVHSTRRGFFPIPFDITNAFIRASMGSIKVCVRLPESFRSESSDDGKRILLRALYGLPVSPKLWNKTLNRDLESLGWRQSNHEPGVWILKERDEVVGICTVYVDDCVVACETKESSEAELEKIHNLHPLTRISTKKFPDGSIEFDLLGADVLINTQKREFKLSMTKYVDKLLARFDMTHCKALSTPSFEEAQLYAKADLCPKFEYRSLIGGLQWLSTVCRPDLAHSVGMLARASANPVTNSMVKCGRRVLRYLKGTREYGLTFSPEQEREFNLKYSKLLNHPDNIDFVKPDQLNQAVHTFSDASFGVSYRTMRSISGTIIYLHSTPVAWRSKVQSVFSSSTTESEWIAMSDSISISESVHAVHEFLLGKPALQGPIWCDNRGAVVSARKGPEGTDEISKRTRHVALRFAKVLPEFQRIWFSPTDQQLADGLTKSCNREALQNLFHGVSAPLLVEDGDEDFDGDETYFATSFLVRPFKNLTFY